MKEFKVGAHLTQAGLEELLLYITRWFGFMNTMYRVVKVRDHYDLYWTMTQNQYKRLCADYRKTLE